MMILYGKKIVHDNFFSISESSILENSQNNGFNGISLENKTGKTLNSEPTNGGNQVTKQYVYPKTLRQDPKVTKHSSSRMIPNIVNTILVKVSFEMTTKNLLNNECLINFKDKLQIPTVLGETYRLIGLWNSSHVWTPQLVFSYVLLPEHVQLVLAPHWNHLLENCLHLLNPLIPTTNQTKMHEQPIHFTQRWRGLNSGIHAMVILCVALCYSIRILNINGLRSLLLAGAKEMNTWDLLDETFEEVNTSVRFYFDVIGGYQSDMD